MVYADSWASRVNKIHFVTSCQIPEWPDTSHPKHHLVDHKDFIPPQYFPTLNSCTIEMNMHRIGGLTERFVYFNDDVFLLRVVSPDFFFKPSLPGDFFQKNPGSNSDGVYSNRIVLISY